MADDWTFRKFDNGETVYKSGHYDTLFVGARGVGFKTIQTVYDPNSFIVTIDDGKPITYPVSVISSVANLYLFKNSQELLPLILKAKNVKISFGGCGNFFRGFSQECYFTSAGEPYSATWEFEKPLAEQFKDFN